MIGHRGMNYNAENEVFMTWKVSENLLLFRIYLSDGRLSCAKTRFQEKWYYYV